MIGYAITGSFCTHKKSVEMLRVLVHRGLDVVPILSPSVMTFDTRFGTAADLVSAVEQMTGRTVISSITAAEPIGPKQLLDVLVIAPCTGNTLGKLAGGVTDTPVAMAAKAHLRNDRPVVLAIATNDGLSASAQNIGTLLARKNYYFVPFGQDDADNKPCSLIADFTKIEEAVEAALEGRQYQPLLLK